jgi:hypothetical protein
MKQIKKCALMCPGRLQNCRKRANNSTQYHSEFRPLEVTRHEVLSDRMVLHYFEVRKLPKEVDVKHELPLLLSLFRAKTEEELKQLERLGVPVVTQAIEAYREVTVSAEFREALIKWDSKGPRALWRGSGRSPEGVNQCFLRELERLRELARHNEASALAHARRKGVAEEREKWQSVIADRDARIAELEALLKKNQQI